MREEETSAFPKTLSALGESVREVELDVAAFHRPISACDLTDCRGTCCHDGAYLHSEEAEVIRELVADEREHFEKAGLPLPDQPIVFEDCRNICSGPKTATRSFPMSDRVRDYPAHFPDTNCIFLLPDSRCALQQISSEKGFHPWHFKPATCWMHPITLTSSAPGRGALLTLHTPESDPQRFPDYDGFVSRTHCGRPDPHGTPAHQVLSAELTRLSSLGGRDLLTEIRSNPVSQAT